MNYSKAPKKLKSKKSNILDKNSKTENNKYLKQQNINLASINSESVYKLQNQIGNKQTMILLREIGNLGLLNNSSVDGYNLVDLDDAYKENETTEKNRTVDNFKDLSGNHGLESLDAIDSGRFSVNHSNSEANRGKMGDFKGSLTGLIKLVDFLKGYDGREDEKVQEIKDGDSLLSDLEKTKKNEVSMVINMIENLPNFSTNDDVVAKYMKVQNFLISSGCNLNEFFSMTGDMNKQKELILKAIEMKI